MSAPSPHLKRFLRLRLFVHSMVSGYIELACILFNRVQVEFSSCEWWRAFVHIPHCDHNKFILFLFAGKLCVLLISLRPETTSTSPGSTLRQKQRDRVCWLWISFFLVLNLGLHSRTPQVWITTIPWETQQIHMQSLFGEVWIWKETSWSNISIAAYDIDASFCRSFWQNSQYGRHCRHCTGTDVSSGPLHPRRRLFVLADQISILSIGVARISLACPLRKHILFSMLFSFAAGSCCLSWLSSPVLREWGWGTGHFTAFLHHSHAVYSRPLQLPPSPACFPKVCCDSEGGYIVIWTAPL